MLFRCRWPWRPRATSAIRADGRCGVVHCGFGAGLESRDPRNWPLGTRSTITTEREGCFATVGRLPTRALSGEPLGMLHLAQERWSYGAILHVAHSSETLRSAKQPVLERDWGAVRPNRCGSAWNKVRLLLSGSTQLTLPAAAPPRRDGHCAFLSRAKNSRGESFSVSLAAQRAGSNYYCVLFVMRSRVRVVFVFLATPALRLSAGKRPRLTTDTVASA